MKKLALVLVLLFAGVASAQQKGVSLGGTHSNLDLFKVYFSWGNAGNVFQPTTGLTLVNATQLWIPVNGSALVPSFLVGTSPLSSIGTSIIAGEVLFNSSGSSSAASLIWSPNTLTLTNSVVGASVGLFSSVTLSPSAISGGYSTTAGSGSDGFSATTNGSHWHVGSGASDYFSSDGTTVTFAGPISITGKVASTNGTTCTLNAGTPATCTASVTAGAICVCSDVGSGSTVAAGGCAVSLSGTTLTVTGATAASNVVNIWCNK